MTVTEVQVAALRAALADDEDTFNRLGGPGRDYGKEFPILVANAFVAAAQRRFPPRWSTSDVVLFVGQLRGRGQGVYADISADAAEQMLVSVLRGEPMGDGDLDEFDKAYAQVAVLAELVSDLNGRQLDILLEEARAQTDEWLADHTDW